MSFRFYIVPVVGTGAEGDARKPKYFADGTLTADWTGMDYGNEPWMIVGADLSGADDATVVGEPDAFALPFDLTANLTSGQVTNVQNKLEAINVPAGWVNTSLTWNTLLRIVLAMFLFLQRFTWQNAGGRLFTGGITLDSTINQVPAGARSNLTAAAQSMGLVTTGITGSTTIRAALKNLADQAAAQPLAIMGRTI